MPLATVPFHDRIAVVFDFDGTLAPDSFDALLARCGVDPARWREERLAPLAEAGWDAALARVWSLIELDREGRGRPVTAALLEEVGRELEPHPGVREMFGRLRGAAEAVAPGVEVEFRLLSSGFAHLQRASPIAGEFRAIWGTELHFAGGDGRLAFARQVVTHPEKVRYLLQLAKGLGTEGANAPADVWREAPKADWRVPLDQMVYVGDGASDLPAFQLMREGGGIGLGVFARDGSAEEWSARGRMHRDRRVENLAAADFREGSELLRSATLAMEAVAKRVALRRLGAGE